MQKNRDPIISVILFSADLWSSWSSTVRHFWSRHDHHRPRQVVSLPLASHQPVSHRVKLHLPHCRQPQRRNLSRYYYYFLFFIFYFFSSSKFKRIRVELYLLLQKLVLTLTTRSYITFKEAVFKVFKDYNKKSECVLYVALWNLKSQNDIF
jgi:hypothetical protein